MIGSFGPMAHAPMAQIHLKSSKEQAEGLDKDADLQPEDFNNGNV